MVGAADLNDKFRSLVKSFLRKERYLEDDEDTLDIIIAAEVMPKFENEIKRAFRYKDHETAFSIRMRGLKKSTKQNRIRDNYLVLT